MVNLKRVSSGAIREAVLGVASSQVLGFEELSKLELAAHLTCNGWNLSTDTPEFFGSDGPYLFHVRAFLHSKAYLLALAQSAQIFAKDRGLRRIYHGGTEGYYLCLMRLPDLARIIELGDPRAQSDKFFRALLHGIDVAADAPEEDAPPAIEAAPAIPLPPLAPLVARSAEEHAVGGRTNVGPNPANLRQSATFGVRCCDSALRPKLIVC